MWWSLLLSIFTVVELNCENLFHFTNDSVKQDQAFTPEGLYRWTPNRYWKKVNNIGKEILMCAEMPNGSYAIPDLVALCEVENDSVMHDLTRRSVLRNANYEYIITRSPDERGINVALLYSPFTFGYISHHAVRVPPLKGMKPTRDILYVKGRTAHDDTLHVVVVHAPSRSGGEYQTRQYRKHTMNTVATVVDSINAVSPRAKIIVTGDFNDPASARSMRPLYDSKLYNISANCRGQNGALGTYKYRGKWESIDHFFVSKPLHAVATCRLNDHEALLCRDEDWGGVKPKRCYNGIRWQDGYSDHLPLVAYFEL